jgi:hypothetical protein
MVEDNITGAAPDTLPLPTLEDSNGEPIGYLNTVL